MECPGTSSFHAAPDILPVRIGSGIRVSDFIELVGGTCFEARNLAKGGRLLREMIEGGCCIWLGIAGAGIAGGLGGPVIDLIENGFVDVICTTGAQAYHDLHFAFDLPVKAVNPEAHDDEDLRRRGDTRIYDIGIREKETLEAQDEIICRFINEAYDGLRREPLSSPRFMMLLGEWAARCAPHPERSFVVAAARAGVPVFWDSMTNHSVALCAARMQCEGYELHFSPQEDVLLSASLAYGSRETGFVELGGGGPKNFIQQTGPTISQILGVDYRGASRGLQIGTASVREGGLSGCTFGEAVTWGKYAFADGEKLVQIWGEYSVIFPMVVAYVLDRCQPRYRRGLYLRMARLRDELLADARETERTSCGEGRGRRT